MVEEALRLFRTQLIDAWDGLVEKSSFFAENPRWGKTVRKVKRTLEGSDTPLKLVAHTLWLQNLLASWGVLFGLGPNSVSSFTVQNPGINEAAARRLATLMSAALSLQYLIPYTE